MFTIEKEHYNRGFYILTQQEGCNYFLHGDGRILSTAEYWPTGREAQAVLDWYTPKHTWEHGDVFRDPDTDAILMYIQADPKDPEVVYLEHPTNTECPVGSYLQAGNFLFNIKEKLNGK